MVDVDTEGNFGDVNFPELVLRLYQTAKTGMLRAEREGIIKVIYFRDGEISFASSNEDSDRLGHVFMRAGKLTEQQLELAMSRVDAKTSLGKTFISLGFITPKELLWGARKQVEDILLSLYTWRDGRFQFIEGPLPKKIANLRLPTPQVLARTIPQVTDRDWVFGRLGSLDTVFSTRKGAFDEIKNLELGDEVEIIVAKVDGARSVRDLSTLSRMDDFTVSKILYALYLLGMLEVEKGEGVEAAGEGELSAYESEPDPMGLSSLSDDMNFSDLFSDDEPRREARPIPAPARTAPTPATADTVVFKLDEVDVDAGMETMAITPQQAEALRNKAIRAVQEEAEEDSAQTVVFEAPLLPSMPGAPAPAPSAPEEAVEPERVEAEESSFRGLFEEEAAEKEPEAFRLEETGENESSTPADPVEAEPALSEPSPSEETEESEMPVFVSEEAAPESAPITYMEEPEEATMVSEPSPLEEPPSVEEPRSVMDELLSAPPAEAEEEDKLALDEPPEEEEEEPREDEATTIAVSPPFPAMRRQEPPPPAEASEAASAREMPLLASIPRTEEEFADLFRDDPRSPVAEKRPVPRPPEPSLAVPPGKPAAPAAKDRRMLAPMPVRRHGSSRAVLVGLALVVVVLVGVAYLNWELLQPYLPDSVAALLGGRGPERPAPTRATPRETITPPSDVEAPKTDTESGESASTEGPGVVSTEKPETKPAVTPELPVTERKPAPDKGKIEPAVTVPPPPAPKPTFETGRALLRQGKHVEAAKAFLDVAAGDKTRPYTVQLEIDCQVSSLEDAVKNGGGPDTAIFFVPKSLKGRSCYLVLWGVHGSQEQASRAMEEVPPALIEGGAKPRVARLDALGL